MKALTPDLNNNSSKSLYIQLYEYLRDEITNGNIADGERLPSLRDLSDTLGISITTCQGAYDQLGVEGYIDSVRGSGYYVRNATTHLESMKRKEKKEKKSTESSKGSLKELTDPDTFDFVKWKKCFTSVMNESPDALLRVADPQGEPELRYEISDYLYTSRGVSADPEDIVVSAGVQQLTQRLTRILKELGVDIVDTEDPGYTPVRNIFRDAGFSVNDIPVGDDGIAIEKLPVNIRSAVYVSPSNQFPTGSVMPVPRRYQLLEWAEENSAVVIEDDYDSELRYFGNPIPALKSLDDSGRAVYLGSFSSTVFPAIKISYMVLPPELMDIFRKTRGDYDQTCSKAEQLVLAKFMSRGFYQTNIRKLRKLCSKKLELLKSAFAKYQKSGKAAIKPAAANSGLSLRLMLTGIDNREFLKEAAKLGVRATLLPGNGAAIYFYQIPLSKIDGLVKQLVKAVI